VLEAGDAPQGLGELHHVLGELPDFHLCEFHVGVFDLRDRHLQLGREVVQGHRSESPGFPHPGGDLRVVTGEEFVHDQPVIL